MSEVLYRKYRPKEFKDVLGQEHIINALLGALKQGNIAHAYLFSGSRGTGKTSVARILAKEIKCSPNDLYEIDAASNRGIDDIRELREAVMILPFDSPYKVYIIDEVHMLTKEAFNALLKTLEEPPAHAVFVLATTELDRVPATIVSRTQHYAFHRPGIKDIADLLARVSKKEGVALDSEGARMIAFAAEGSLRDAESILGQIMAVEDKEITRDEVERILGMPRRDSAKALFELIAKKDMKTALALIQEIANHGYDMNFFSKMLLQYFRTHVQAG